MPRIATNYEITKVSFYRFACNDPEIKSSYVGHTTNFTERKAHHKHNCNSPTNKSYNYKLYQIIRDNGGFENWRMIEIESRLVKDKREAERIETEFMEKFQSDMNTYKAHRIFETEEEYCKDYHTQHKEDITKQRASHHLDNKQSHNEISRQHYLDNKEDIKNQKREKIECECGVMTVRGHIQRHQKSPKHAKLMELKIASII